MKSKISFNQIKKNVGISIIAQIVSLIVSFIMNLILPKFITEYQYAMWQTYLLYVSYVGILHFGLLDGIALRYSQYDYDEIDKPRIRSQFNFLLVLTSTFCLIVTFFSHAFAQDEMKIVFLFVAIGIISKTVYTYTSNSFQITNRIKEYAKLTIFYRLFYGIGMAFLIICNFHNFYYFCIMDLLSDFFGVLYAIHSNKEMYFGKSIGFREMLKEVKVNISSGIMLMISNWSGLLLTSGARFVIQLHWDKITFGKVSFSFSITNLFLSFVTAISIVLFPSLKRMEQNELPILYKKIMNIMSPFLIFILIFYYPGCWVLNKWIPKYHDSLVYLGYLLPLIIYSSKINLLTNNYLKTLRKEKIMLLINSISVLFAFLFFGFSAFIFDNLQLLLIFIVVSLMLCSFLSEFVVMRKLKIFNFTNFIDEIIMTILFYLSTFLPSQLFGFVLYTCSVIIYLFKLFFNKSVYCVKK